MRLATALNTAVRPQWHSLPQSVRDHITGRTGPVQSAHTQPGGYTPGLAASLRTGGGSVFVKALPDRHPLAGSYRREAAVAQALPGGVPAPRLLWAEEARGWIILAYENAGDRHARLAPASGDLPAVQSAISAARVPAPPGPPDVAVQRQWLHGWAELADVPSRELDPWAALRFDTLAAAETRWPDHAGGGTLVHGDLRADNILISDAGAAVLVDWAYAARGADWLDLADTAVQLILARHTPAAAQQRVAGSAAWQNAPQEGITAYLAALTGYWLRSSRLPAPADSPHIRDYQARAARAGIRWLRYREETA